MSTTPTAAQSGPNVVTVACEVTSGSDAPLSVQQTVPPKIAAATLRSLADQIDPPTPRRRRSVKDGIETKSAGSK